MDLFESAHQSNMEGVPLADRMRPRDLSEFEGQDHIVGEGRPLRAAIEKDNITPIIFWGPPGSGKTTLARIIADATEAEFVSFSAVTSGVPELRKVIAEAKDLRKFQGRPTILFVDEIHRFNKAQQDAFLPHVEDGTVILIGATTENPSFEVIPPLRSRVSVYVLNQLGSDNLSNIINRALSDAERGLGSENLEVDEDALESMVALSDGDARIALNILENSAFLAIEEYHSRRIDIDTVREAAQRKTLLYDKTGEEHYNLISALHKSLRDSDPDASLYWLGRMLEAGEDPLYIARRMIRCASEDVGMADPNALVVCISAMQAAHFVGMPECNLALAEAAVYLATAPKSNTLEAAYDGVAKDVKEHGSLPVPLHIRNAPTSLMRDLGYGRGYKYAHHHPEAQVQQQHLPEVLKKRKYYHPTDRGYEKTIGERLRRWLESRGE